MKYLSILLFLVLIAPQSTRAEDAPKDAKATPAAAEAKPVEAPPASAEAAKPAPEEADVSKLAEEYWRPGEDELGVIQDRRYDKAKRIEASIMYGFYQGGGYLDTKSQGIALAYHVSNAVAFELSYLQLKNKKSEFLKAVEAQYGFTPDYNAQSSQSSAEFVWTPIYAKFALLGKRVSQFETYFAPGVGYTTTLEKHFTKNLSIGEKFFVTENLVLRLEWKMSFYTDRITATQGTYAIRNGGPGSYEQHLTTHNLMFGLGWLF